MLNQESKYKDMREQHDEIMVKHQETVAACNAVEERNWSQAADLFYKAADSIQRAPAGPPQQGYHVVFVLDESGSMVRTAYTLQLYV